MHVEEQEQVQHIIQAALAHIYEHPQPVYNGIRYLVQYLESNSASYTAEDIRDILQLFNDVLKLMSFEELIIFPLPPSFEPYLMQPEIFAFCQSEIVGCYWAAFHWSRRFY